MPDYRDVWSQHTSAVNNLYANLGQIRPAAAEMPDVDRDAERVIATSRELAQAAGAQLSAPNAADRETAMLRLVAAAATDLAIANDLLRAEGGETVTLRGIRPTYARAMADLGPILEPGSVPQTAAAIRDATPTPTPAPAPVDPVTRLKTTARLAYESIIGDVTNLGTMTLSGLLTLPVAELNKAISLTASELLKLLSADLSRAVRRVAEFVVEAYDKLLTALGRDLASKARQQTARWIRTLQSGTMFDQLLGQLYEKERILADIERHGRQVGDVAAQRVLNSVLSDTRMVAERFQRQHRSLEWVLRGLNFGRDRLLVIQPWGPLAVTGLYVTAFTYTVYAGGDYVDWFRVEGVEPLDRVPGLRDVVREGLQADQSDAQ